jgi:membrane-associated phospholipid phosphatase
MLSTSVLGIHWLTDIVAGLATGVVAVTVARLMERSITWPAES